MPNNFLPMCEDDDCHKNHFNCTFFRDYVDVDCCHLSDLDAKHKKL